MSIWEIPEKAVEVLLARLDKANEHLQGATTENSDNDSAKEHQQGATTENLDNDSAKEHLPGARTKHADNDSVKQHLREATTEYADADSVKKHLQEAITAHADNDSAKEHLQGAITEHADNDSATVHLQGTTTEHADNDSAKEHLQEATTEHPDNDSAKKHLQEATTESADNDSAKKHLQGAITEHVDNDSAKDHLQGAITEHVDNNSAKEHLQGATTEHVDNDSAKKNLQEATPESADNNPAKEHLWEATPERADNDSAKEHLQGAITEYADNDSAKEHLQGAMTESADNDSAKEHLQGAITEHADNDSAKKHLQGAITEQTDNDSAKEHLQGTMTESADNDSAKEHLQGTITEYADNDSAKEHLQKATTEHGDNDLAKEHLQEATTENADNDLEIMEPEIMKSELNELKDVFSKIQDWKKTIMEQLCARVQELDKTMLKDPKIMESQVHGQKQEPIKDSIAKLRSLISEDGKGDTSRPVSQTFELKEDGHPMTVLKEQVDLRIEGEISKSGALSSLAASFNRLVSSQMMKMCLLCLSVFPKHSVIEKKPLIYWWMGEGIVTEIYPKKAEEIGEQVFEKLLNEGFISHPSGDNKTIPSVNSFIVELWIRWMLILMAEDNGFLKFTPKKAPSNSKRRAFLLQGNNESYNISDGEKEDLVTVFNVNEQYLGMRPEWLAKLKKVEVLQLGRWQNSVRHHIEVENEKLLIDGLGFQKHLKYLSLRGISGIHTLPSSILKLISLQILDLRACHNLERLPPSISKLKNLTHLDMSECYLLDSMPKGLDQLPQLQVLKGFVVGNMGKKSGCRITDLARLAKLRKLGIRVVNQGEAKKDDQLDSLRKFRALRNLRISWRSKLSAAVSVSLPLGLSKLDLQCVPFEAVPKWLWPSKLPKLEKLYINGGKLQSLEHQDDIQSWSRVKFLRLKNLNNLKIAEEKLVSLFPASLYG